MIIAEDLKLSFEEGKPVLNGLSFRLERGQIMGVLGASGCGKSTLLRVLAGLERANSGSYTLDSDEIGFVFQDAALMPWATVLENVLLPLKLKDRADRTSAKEYLKEVDLEGFEDRYPLTLSGGQKMRVSIARALASGAQLLLLDEPFAALDEPMRYRMNELVLKLRDEFGLSIIFVTHSLYEAAFLADCVCVMEKGAFKHVIEPGIDRTLEPLSQRTSEAHSAAVKALATALNGEGT